MPRSYVTEKTLPLILYELDKWSGKLTWDRFADRVAFVLGEEHVGRHALIRYPQIFDAFNERQKELAAKETSVKPDITVEDALRQIDTLEAQNARLKRQVELFQEQFVRWLENLRMMPNVDLEKLNRQINKPLPKVERR